MKLVHVLFRSKSWFQKIFNPAYTEITIEFPRELQRKSFKAHLVKLKQTWIFTTHPCREQFPNLLKCHVYICTLDRTCGADERILMLAHKKKKRDPRFFLERNKGTEVHELVVLAKKIPRWRIFKRLAIWRAVLFSLRYTF